MAKRTKYIPFTTYIVIWIVFTILTCTVSNLFLRRVYCILAPLYLAFVSFMYETRTAKYLYENYPSSCEKTIRKYTPGLPPEADVIGSLSNKVLMRGVHNGTFFEVDETVRRIYRNSNIYDPLFRFFASLFWFWEVCLCLWGN